MEEAKKKIQSFRFIATGIKTTELLVAGCWLLVTSNQPPETQPINRLPLLAKFSNNPKSNIICLKAGF